jgi:hypothetical protein
MRIDQLMIAVAIALASATEASAGTVCVQNKQTGMYEPKSPVKDGSNPCTAMNPATTAAAAAVMQPASPSTAQPAAAIAVVAPLAPQTISRGQEAQAELDPATVTRRYQLKFSDTYVRLALKRWLKEVGMQLAYEAPHDFSVPVEGDYTGPISDVLYKLMTSLKQSTYPLRACEYDNRVVLIVHRGEACPLEDE